MKLTLSIFFYQDVFLHNQKVRPLMQISWERKELLASNKNHFFIIFKGLLLKQQKQFFWIVGICENKWIKQNAVFVHVIPRTSDAACRSNLLVVGNIWDIKWRFGQLLLVILQENTLHGTYFLGIIPNILERSFIKTPANDCYWDQYRIIVGESSQTKIVDLFESWLIWLSLKDSYLIYR